ncbi:MAG: serine/threonine protein kinase [Lentisphaeraceae bacterium]|nr:serine/threonine protein kinase [Lentisphaeraceae bacterium]
MGTSISCEHCSETLQVPSERIASGVVISDYVIQKQIGMGRIATVYLAHQISLDRLVAMKILSQELADESDFIMDFFTEARAASRLNHPNIVQAYAVNEENGIYFLAMEYIEGSDLQSLLAKRGALPFDECLRILHQIAEALSFCWEGYKMCHENIKPENILLAKGNTAKLSDLGLSKLASFRETSAEYCSPEKIIKSSTDIRTDLYCLGLIFFETLTGEKTFSGETNEEIRREHLKGTHRDPRELREGIPDGYTLILDKLLAKHPDDRYQKPADLIEDIKLARMGKKAAHKVLHTKSPKPSKKSLRQVFLFQTSLFVNVVLVLIIFLMLIGKTPIETPHLDKGVDAKVSQLEQLAIDMNEEDISPERASHLLEDLNLYMQQFPDSPYWPFLQSWETLLEEKIVSMRRLELHKKELKDLEEIRILSKNAERIGK